MADYRVEVMTGWRVMDDGTNEMAVAVDYPSSRGWSDLTGQPDVNIPTDPNAFVARGIVSDAQLTALEADANYVVLIAEAV